ncbi:hypothetical protein GGS26DRAFT_320347 [Hypomontagnella submonticulosa]|nr:hypothetical protein GGS26DRAFT_320347 [Hypomontagnella submonticulosa]
MLSFADTEAMLMKMMPGEDQAGEAQLATIGRCGLGTVNNPLIEYTCNMGSGDDLIHFECETILHRLAKELNFSHVSVTRPPKRTTEAWNRLIIERTSTNLQWLEQGDRHFIVRFGTKASRCDMLGHIYLAIDRENVLDIMNRREFVVGYDDRVLQIWCWNKAQSSELFPWVSGMK